MAYIVALLCVTILWTDLHYRKVPNLALAVALIAAAIVWALGLDSSMPLASRALGFALGFAIMLPAYVLGRMGAGDVKFFAVAGLFIGPSALLPVWLAGTLLAFVHACLVVALRHPRVHGVMATVGRWPWCARWIGAPGADAPSAAAGQPRGIPYAAYLAMGVLLWISAGQSNS